MGTISSNLSLLMVMVIFSQPLCAMQFAKLKKGVVTVPRHRQNCWDRVSFKGIGTGLLVTGLAIGAAFLSYMGNPELFPGCPGECNHAATRFNDEASQALLLRCQANSNCPEIGDFSYWEEVHRDQQVP